MYTHALSLFIDLEPTSPRVGRVGGVFTGVLELSGLASVSQELVTSSCLIGLLFVRRYPDMPCAADVVNALDQQALASVLAAYGEERHTRKIAAAIAQARSIYPIGRTLQLASIVAGTPPPLIPYARGRRGERKMRY